MGSRAAFLLEREIGFLFNRGFHPSFQLGVLNVLSYLIERMGVAIRPFCGDLVQYLPALWDASSDHNMLRCSILSTLVSVVQVT